MENETILLDHGGGGLLSHELVTREFLPLLKNEVLERLEDSARITAGQEQLCFTTDSYVVQPIFFPGGDIGSLAVHGTLNDIAMSGGVPLCLSCACILEEGFPMSDLRRIVRSLADAAAGAGVPIVTGDTKVVPRGAADGIFINTSGIGRVRYGLPLTPTSIREGDVVIVNGTIGDHGAAITSCRENLGLSSAIMSDSAPLHGLVAAVLAGCGRVHCMRDATRGGLGSILAEIAQQSGLRIDINEQDIPVREDVRGVCEILGLDPLFLANEGKMALFAPEDQAGDILKIMQGHAFGSNAAVIGRVGPAQGRGRLVLRTLIGGEREIDLPTGELVPRIC